MILSKRNIVIDCQRQFQSKYNKICSIAGKVDSGFIIFNEEDLDFNNQVFVRDNHTYKYISYIDARVDTCYDSIRKRGRVNENK